MPIYKISKCKSGSILRKGYTRHSKNKTVRVKKGCIKAQSQSGKKRSVIDRRQISRRRRIHATMRKLFGTKKCGKGRVVRAGYTRKAHGKKSASRVAPGCIKATGLSKKRGTTGKQLFVLEKGALTKYGYHADLSENDRHQALSRALADGLKPLSLFRKLNALYVLNKNKNRALAKLYRTDAKWIKDTPEYMAR